MNVPPATLASAVSSFAERRRYLDPPTYRAIAPACAFFETGSYKQAAQFIEKSQKKPQRASYAVSLLRCLALAKSSRAIGDGTSKKIADCIEHVKGSPDALADPDVILLVCWLAQAAQLDDALEAFLSEVMRLHGSNTEACTEVFWHHLRSGRWSSAQQVAERLKATTNEERYAWWTIATIVLQARFGSAADGQVEAGLGMAQEALERHAKESAKEYADAHQFRLVSRLLELFVERQGREATSHPAFASANNGSSTAAEALLEHLSTPAADEWCGNNLGLELRRRELELAYATKPASWQAARQHLRASLEAGDTNWHTMLYHIRFSVCLAADRSWPAEQAALVDESSMADAEALFKELATRDERGQKERGFSLAALELAQQQHARGWSSADMCGLMHTYIERFGHKSCCFDDLLPYLETLDDSQQSRLVAGLPARDDTTTVAAVQRAITASKLTRHFSTDSAETLATLADELVKTYLKALPLGANLPKTEIQPADDLLLLAAQVQVQIWSLTKNDAHLANAACLLEYGLTKSHYRYQLRLLLICIYRLLGAPLLAYQHFRQLGVKMIQHDTLLHLVTTRGATYAFSGSSTSSHNVEVASARRFYGNGEYEAAEMPARAVHQGAFTQVEDFVEFRERLLSSLSKRLNCIEGLRLEVLNTVPSAFDFDEADVLMSGASLTGMLSDNRDFATLPSYQPRNSPSVWELVSMGPRVGDKWLASFRSMYASVLAPPDERPTLSPSSDELTPTEYALMSFVASFKECLARSESTKEQEAASMGFFKEQDAALDKAIQEALPWEVAHIAEIALEGFCLLDLAIDDKAAELSSGKKTPATMKHVRRLKELRGVAQGMLRPLANRLSNHAKQVAKQRGQYASEVELPDEVDSDETREHALKLADARKQTLDALASAIMKRCK